MKKNKLVKISAIIAAALLISACSTNVRGPQEKIAVINWEQAVSAHPQYAKLEQGEKILQDLLNKRKGQEELAKAQLSSLNKLRSLRQLSQQSFMEADFNTRMVEQREIENAKLQKFAAQAEAEADNQLAERKKNIEEAYKLKLFNLRAILETVKMKPDERQAVEKQLQELQKVRRLPSCRRKSAVWLMLRYCRTRQRPSSGCVIWRSSSMLRLCSSLNRRRNATRKCLTQHRRP